MKSTAKWHFLSLRQPLSPKESMKTYFGVPHAEWFLVPPPGWLHMHRFCAARGLPSALNSREQRGKVGTHELGRQCGLLIHTLKTMRFLPTPSYTLQNPSNPLWGKDSHSEKPSNTSSIFISCLSVNFTMKCISEPKSKVNQQPNNTNLLTLKTPRLLALYWISVNYYFYEILPNITKISWQGINFHKSQ